MVKGHLEVLAEVPFPCSVRSFFYGELFHWKPWNLTCISCFIFLERTGENCPFQHSNGWLLLVKINLENAVVPP